VDLHQIKDKKQQIQLDEELAKKVLRRLGFPVRSGLEMFMAIGARLHVLVGITSHQESIEQSRIFKESGR
jgi:hypothetical protein